MKYIERINRKRLKEEKKKPKPKEKKLGGKNNGTS